MEMFNTKQFLGKGVATMFRDLFPVVDGPVVDRDRIEVDQADYSSRPGKRQKGDSWSTAVYEPYIEEQINKALAINRPSASKLTVAIANALVTRFMNGNYTNEEPPSIGVASQWADFYRQHFNKVGITAHTEKIPNGFCIDTATLAPITHTVEHNAGTVIWRPFVRFSIHQNAQLNVAHRNGKDTVDWCATHQGLSRDAGPMLPETDIEAHEVSETRYLIRLSYHEVSQHHYIFSREPVTRSNWFCPGVSIVFPAGTTFGEADLDPTVVTPALIVCALLRQIGEQFNNDGVRVVPENVPIAAVLDAPVSSTERNGLIAFFNEYVTDLLTNWATAPDKRDKRKFNVLDICM